MIKFIVCYDYFLNDFSTIGLTIEVQNIAVHIRL